MTAYDFLVWYETFMRLDLLGVTEGKDPSVVFIVIEFLDYDFIALCGGELV